MPAAAQRMVARRMTNLLQEMLPQPRGASCAEAVSTFCDGADMHVVRQKRDGCKSKGRRSFADVTGSRAPRISLRSSGLRLLTLFQFSTSPCSQTRLRDLPATLAQGCLSNPPSHTP